jgi:hypothetical protein
METRVFCVTWGQNFYSINYVSSSNSQNKLFVNISDKKFDANFVFIV